MNNGQLIRVQIGVINNSGVINTRNLLIDDAVSSKDPVHQIIEKGSKYSPN